MKVRATWAVLPGEQIAPGREAIRALGGGSRYEVYLAFDRALRAAVVVKMLRPDRISSASALRGLEREWRILTSVAHPSIVRAFDAVLSGDRPHLVLECVAGQTVKARERPSSAEAVRTMGEQIAAGLHFLARNGLVHLDVKPSNIMLGSRATLIDFSIARPVGEAASLEDAVGTAAFMSPEQIAPGIYGRPGPASDVWGLGMSMYVALTGSRPFGKGVREAATVGERYPQVNTPVRAPDAGPLGALIIDCLRKDADARPTATEVGERLSLMGALSGANAR